MKTYETQSAPDPPNSQFLRHGSAQPLPERVAMRAGPLALVFEAGDLRYLTLGGREVIRRIYAAVRDRNWGTVPSVISNLELHIADQSFRITYTSTHRLNEIHFVWQAGITGEADGTIRFAFDGEAKSTFLRNRIGFCVLHPIRECAGAKCRAIHPGGAGRELRFPDVIAAEQPVTGLHDLAGLAHEIEPGVWAELKFEGDVFETEDQRNWIDASFKTFCTPLRLPYPVEMKTGTRIRQSVSLKLRGIENWKLEIENLERPASPTESTPTANSQFSILNSQSPITVTPGASARPLPALGLGASSDKSPENFPNKSRLGALHLSHLRHDVRLGSANWGHELLCASLEASTLKLPLELAVHLPILPGDQLAELAGWLTEMRVRFPQIHHIARLLIFQDGQQSTPRAALDAARAAFGNLKLSIGAGTNADLYQLNLQRPPADADFICWSMNPQVHAFDNASIAETPEAVAHQIASVKKYFPGKALVVSPVTLKPRFNPVTTGPEPPVPPGELPPQVDPRQLSLFGAAWTLAMLKQLAESGVSSATFYETTGWRGVMETAGGSPLPEKFPSIPGAVFPLYHVLADVGEFAGGEVITSCSSDPLKVETLALRRDKRRALLLANLTDEPQRVDVRGFAKSVQIRLLDETNALAAMTEPEQFRSVTALLGATKDTLELTLRPCAFACLDANG